MYSETASRVFSLLYVEGGRVFNVLCSDNTIVVIGVLSTECLFLGTVIATVVRKINSLICNIYDAMHIMYAYICKWETKAQPWHGYIK